GELPLTQPSPDGRGLVLPLPPGPPGEGRGEGPLRVRIGIATGLVVVGDLIGAGSAQEQAIVGETPNLAARLQALAEPNAIVIADEPHVRLRYFCSPHHQDSALYPVIAQMERAAGFTRDDAPDAKLAKLKALRAAAPPEDIALLAELHSLPSAQIALPLDVSPQ